MNKLINLNLNKYPQTILHLLHFQINNNMNKNNNFFPVRDGIVLSSNHGLPNYAHASMDLSQDDHMITSHGRNPLDDPSEHKNKQNKRQRTCFGTYTEQSFGQEHSLGFFDDISRKEDENTSQHT